MRQREYKRERERESQRESKRVRDRERERLGEKGRRRERERRQKVGGQIGKKEGDVRKRNTEHIHFPIDLYAP